MTKLVVGPHDYRPISILDRLIGRGARCVDCYQPKWTHPTGYWDDARPIGCTAPANWPNGVTWPVKIGIWKMRPTVETIEEDAAK